MSDTIFGKILRGEVPADIIYQDDHCIAIRDVNPQAPVHVLVIPRKDLVNVASATVDDVPLLGHLLNVCTTIAEAEGIKDAGFRIVANNGPASGQTVDHLHFHVLGGRDMAWPPG
jgi:histidine triad (HIT) family protein